MQEDSSCDSRVVVFLFSRALLTVSKESALREAGNFVLASSVVHGVAGFFGFMRMCIPLGILRLLTQLAQKFGSCRVRRKW